jgi:hypothetical protein
MVRYGGAVTPPRLVALTNFLETTLQGMKS